MMTESPAKDDHPQPATRKKVKHACYQCKMAHAACDIQRPCKRYEIRGPIFVFFFTANLEICDSL